jgi:predicted PurR-regulated permease PerM
MIELVIFLILCLVASIVININLLKKLEKFEKIYDDMIEEYEEFFNNLQNTIKNVISRMRSIDLRGAFEADDEVGIVFQGMLQLVASLEGLLEREAPQLYEETKTKDKPQKKSDE